MFKLFIRPIYNFKFLINPRLSRFAQQKENWIYGQKSVLINVELKNILSKLESTDKAEYVILDVRTDDEIGYADLPAQNQNGVYIPKINYDMRTIFSMQDQQLERSIPKNKYIICMCHIGERSSRVAFHLKSKGYKTLNLYGGIHMMSELYENIPQY